MSHIPPENPAPSPEKSTVPVKVLLVDAHIETAETIEKSLLIASDGAFRVVWASCISQALEHLARGDIEVVIAVLDLADCEEAEVFQQLQLSAPEALVLPLGKTSAHSMPEQDRQNTIDTDWLPGALDYVARRKILRRHGVLQTRPSLTPDWPAEYCSKIVSIKQLAWPNGRKGKSLCCL